MFKALYLYQSQKINHMLPGIYTGKQPPNLPKPCCESTHGKSLNSAPGIVKKFQIQQPGMYTKAAVGQVPKKQRTAATLQK